MEPQCTSNPQLWGAIAGPDTPKGNGDEYMTRTCNTRQRRLHGTTNDEFDPQGYFYIVRVRAARRGHAGHACRSTTRPGSRTATPASRRRTTVDHARNNMNSYTPDGLTRDTLTDAPGGRRTTSAPVTSTTAPPTQRITTSYDLRNPTDTYNPKQRHARSSAACASTSSTRATAQDRQVHRRAAPRATAPSPRPYNDDLAKVYHQWVKLCTFTPTAGRRLLPADPHQRRARRHVRRPGRLPEQPQVYTQTGDDTTVGGSGNNRFAIRVNRRRRRGAVSISGYQHMSIYANYTGANTDVQPGAGDPGGGRPRP